MVMMLMRGRVSFWMKMRIECVVGFNLDKRKTLIFGQCFFCVLFF